MLCSHLQSSAKICGILVTYYPNRSVGKNIQIAEQYLDSLVVIDNTSTSKGESVLNNLNRKKLSCLDDIHSSMKEKGRIFLLRNNSNLGLARSYNKGVQIARQISADFILLLDQDSMIHPDTMKMLMESYDELRGLKVGAIGCTNVQFNTMVSKKQGEPWGLKPKGYVELGLSQEVFLKENSGLLVPMERFEEVGMFNESFFLDGVDYDFCLSLREHGYKVFRSKYAFISQSAGIETKLSLIGREFKYTARGPERTYSIMESYLMLLKFHRSMQKFLIPKFAVDFALLCFRITFLYGEKMNHYAQMFRGLINGLSGQNSRYHEFFNRELPNEEF